MRGWALAASLSLAVIVPARGAAQHPLLALPIDDIAYAQLDVLTRTGCRAARISAFRPYFAGWVREALGRAKTERACQGAPLTALLTRFERDALASDATFRAGGAVSVSATALGDAEFRPLWRDVRPVGEGTPPVVVQGNGRVSWNGGPRLYGVADLYAVSHGRNSPIIRGRGFRESNAVVDFEEAYLATRTGPLVVLLGRSAEAWLSEGRESLMFSAHGPPMDKVLLTARGKRWQMRAVFATLPDVVLDVARDSIGGTLRHHRMFAAHAISMMPAPGLEFVLGETALINREGGGADLAFVNPAMIYLVTQNDVSYQGPSAPPVNLTTFGSARWAAGRATMGGELTIDDIQIDAPDRKKLPDQLAWRIHASYGLSLAWPSSLALQYRRVDSYTYSKSPYSSVYQHYDTPLGSELGPGADELRATLELHAGTRLRLNTGIAQRRQGALRLEQRPSRSAFGHAGEPYPATSAERPAVQTAQGFDTRVQWLSETMPVSASLEWVNIENVNNSPATSANYLRVNIAGSYRFRYP